MALFGRKKSENSDVPVDLQQYYSSGNGGLVKWIIRIIVFVIILGLLIWAGIWVIQRFTGSDNASSNTNSNNSTSQQQNEDDKSGNGSSDDAPTTNSGGNTGGSSNNNSGTDGSTTPKPATPTPSTPAPAPAPTTATPNASGNLPNTGPGENAMISAFLLVTIAGAFIHGRYIRNSRA